MFGAFLALGATAQTFVSTTPANKNVVLEEYTGINCGYCPDGHKLANQFAAANPGRVVLINIHQGSFANGTPNYKTQWGDALANQTGLTGYPSGTINRRVFSGTTTALNRGEWTSKGTLVLAEPSFVNVDSRAYIDTNTRIITIDVEIYYTSNADSKINLLNVALLQDSVIGPQAGGTQLNPTQVTSDGKYIHKHMLRHLFSNQFGDPIIGEDSVISSGSFFTKRYVYQLPADINNVPLVLKNLNVVAFVTKSNQDIYTGSVGITTLGDYTNAVDINPVLATGLTGSAVPNCSNTTMVENLTFRVKNTGGSLINELKIKYLKNNTFSTYTYNTPIGAGNTASIVLPQVEINNDGKKTSFIAMVSEIDGVNIESTSGISYSSLINNPPISKAGEGKVTLYLKTDYFGDETRWNVRDLSGNLIKQGGPYTKGSNVYDTVNLSLPSIGCYVFEITDTYGDGIGTPYNDNVVGYYKLIDNDGTILINSNGQYGKGEKIAIQLNSYISLDLVSSGIVSSNIYPNPAKDNTNLVISMSENSSAVITVTDILGREVINLGNRSLGVGENNIEINTSSLSNGTYLVRIVSENGISTKKFNISK